MQLSNLQAGILLGLIVGIIVGQILVWVTDDSVFFITIIFGICFGAYVGWMMEKSQA